MSSRILKLAMAVGVLVAVASCWQAMDHRPAQRLIARTGPLDVLLRELKGDLSSPFAWADAGDALIREGQTARAAYCFRRTELLGPAIPATLMRCVNFYLLINESAKALRIAAAVQALSASYDNQLFAYYDAAIQDPLKVVGVLRENSRSLRAYASHLIDSNDFDAIRTVWPIVRSQGALDESLVARYTTLLVGHGRSREARTVWRESTRAAQPDTRGIPESVFNGGFENVPVAGPFDWSLPNLETVSVERDCSVHYHGDCSLRIRFLGDTNIALAGISQQFVLASGSYRLVFYAKSESLTTDQRPYLLLSGIDPKSGVVARSVPVPLETGWKRMEADFHVDAKDNLMAVQVVRDASSKFDNKIAGTVWIDDVSVLPRH